MKFIDWFLVYEIETSSTGLCNTGLGAQSTGGGRFLFWRNTFKNDGKIGFGSPYLLPLLRKSGSAPGLLWTKNIGPYISSSSELILFKKNIGLRPKLGNTYYHNRNGQLFEYNHFKFISHYCFYINSSFVLSYYIYHPKYVRHIFVINRIPGSVTSDVMNTVTLFTWQYAPNARN